MALTDAYDQVYGQLGDFFDRIAKGQAPERFTRQHLKDLGFTSASFNAMIPVMKALGFLADSGSPTGRYHHYRDSSQSRRVMGEALREAYGDPFVIKANPTDADKALIEGKFKSAHNATDRVAKLMASTSTRCLVWRTCNLPRSHPTNLRPRVLFNRLRRLLRSRLCRLLPRCTTTFRFTCLQPRMLRCSTPSSSP